MHTVHLGILALCLVPQASPLSHDPITPNLHSTGTSRKVELTTQNHIESFMIMVKNDGPNFDSLLYMEEICLYCSSTLPSSYTAGKITLLIWWPENKCTIAYTRDGCTHDGLTL